MVNLFSTKLNSAPPFSSVVLAGILGLAGCQLWGLGDQPTARELAGRAAFSWRADSADHFILHVDSALAARISAGPIQIRLERARERALRLLELPTYDSLIHVFMVGSRDRMQQLTGRVTNGIAFHNSRVVVLVSTPDWAASSAHEVFHVIAMSSWGVGPVWLNEGMAALADDQWRGSDLHTAARALLERNALVPLDRLSHDFRAIDELVSYPQAGSFAKYLHARYGVAAIRALWSEDAAEFIRIAGKSLPGAEREWRAFLRTRGEVHD